MALVKYKWCPLARRLERVKEVKKCAQPCTMLWGKATRWWARRTLVAGGDVLVLFTKKMEAVGYSETLKPPTKLYPTIT